MVARKGGLLILVCGNGRKKNNQPIHSSKCLFPTNFNVNNFGDFEADPIYQILQDNPQGTDMIWNPTNVMQLGTNSSSAFNTFNGGGQYIYTLPTKNTMVATRYAIG
jgi:hypothetical protein